MASLIDSLINIMNDENRQYTELLDLSNNKTTAIVKGDVGQLQEIFGKEQKLIDILNRLEMERQSCVADICKILHLSAAEVKVSHRRAARWQSRRSGGRARYCHRRGRKRPNQGKHRSPC